MRIKPRPCQTPENPSSQSQSVFFYHETHEIHEKKAHLFVVSPVRGVGLNGIHSSSRKFLLRMAALTGLTTNRWDMGGVIHRQ